MSTPIETNTEELQEILNTAYNLPMADGVGTERKPGNKHKHRPGL